MLQIRILTIGKVKESWLDQGIVEFIRRLSPRIKIEWVLLKNDAQLEEACKGEKGLIGLDPLGKSFDSPAFSKFLFSQFERQGARLSFIIGGAEGLTDLMRSKCSQFISLSKLTMTHQMCRLFLLEQLYRASEIERGSPYHKD